MASVFTENLVGFVLDQRYSLSELVGVGASARVYRAEDRRLRRIVAVKVLHASFADDEGFVRRFRQEAEALATLNHENVVTVFDVNDGENAIGEPPFLVTEFLAGGTLRDLLDEGYRLSLSQAVGMGLQAARGLEFAHARGLSHRDIKPANLIFGDDRKVRIADFGLAKALQDFGRTEVTGAPIGSARYMAPEQANTDARLPVDGRADVYALALVLIEAVTGSVPFVADGYVGTAIARLKTGISAPLELGELAPLVEQAGTLDPADRLDAAGLVRALEDLARRLPKADPLPIEGTRLYTRVDLVDRDPTRHASLGAGTAKARFTRIEKPGVPTLSVAESAANKKAKQTGIFDISLDEEPAEEQRTQSKREAKRSAKQQAKQAKSNVPSRSTTIVGAAPQRSWRKPVAAMSAVVALGAAGAGATFVATRTPTHTVPALEGKTVAQAKAAVASLKFVVATVEEFNDEVAPGKIIDQTPDSGSRLKERELVQLVVSRGAKPVTVPNVFGLTLDGAQGALVALGLQGVPTFETSDTVEEGKIIRVSPTGDVAPGSTVNLFVSSGKPTIEIPKFAGMTEAEAAAEAGTNFVLNVVKAGSDVPKGIIFGSEPKSGEIVARGSEVKVFVSNGPSFATVPNVINLSPSEASARLRAAGFRIGNTIGPADRPVLHTRPLRNTRARKGAVVTLYTTDDNVPEVPGVAATKRTTKSTSEAKPTTEAKPATESNATQQSTSDDATSSKPSTVSKVSKKTTKKGSSAEAPAKPTTKKSA